MNNKKLDLIFDGLGTLGGLIAFFKGLSISASTIGTTQNALIYGGDAYTGIQNGAAQTASNVYYGNQVLVSFASGLLLALGLAFIAYFGKKFLLEVMDLKAEKTAHIAEETSVAQEPAVEETVAAEESASTEEVTTTEE